MATKTRQLRQAKLLIEDLWEEVSPRLLELSELKALRLAHGGELAELERLQKLADRMIRLVAPLPIKGMEAFARKHGVEV